MKHKLYMLTLAFLMISPTISFAAEKPAKKMPYVKKSYKMVLKNVSVRDVVKMLSKVKPIIIDLRTPREFNQGHLKGAQNINFYSANFVKKLKALDKTKPYLIYCAVGGRSGRTFDAMKKMGFQQVFHMNEGYTKWHAKNLPIVRKKKNLVRQ